ncbi:tetratricopeptide repeat protein [Maricaulis sp.]|uniref:tetratricopeptide repeat protein n=1 Tax=Maricaulis sp. TaxID=1486257 RepID=UPI002621C4F7|nr:tetratricopeptide repeat protein [Maricaulis sp.]
MRQFFLSAALAAGLAVPAMAQDEAAAVTQQTVSIELFGLANQALQAGDFEAAKRALEAVRDLKPGHPAVLNGLVTVARRAEHPEDALDALEAMDAAGLTYDTSRVADWLSEAEPARFAAVNAALAANGEPVGRAERAAVIDRPDALIEGVAVDIETDRIFLSSVAQREILLLEPFAPNDPIVFADQDDGLWSVFGIAVDDRTRMVWAASGVVPQTPMAEGETPGTALFAFDLMTGDLYNRYEIDGAERMADFVVRDGMVYVADAGAPRIYVLNSISGQLELLVEDPRFVSLQGLALTRGALYAADYSTGIWRIDLGDQSVSLVRPGEASLIGIDGLLNTRDGRLVAVRNGAAPHQMMAIDLDRDGREVAATEVLLRAHPDMTGDTEPTLVDLADGRAWLVANAAWPLFPADGNEPESARPATVILEMDLP